ncbi:alpha/beta fold hydrolase [Nocardia sp. bgisy118]|uniref:alpha/beta fold hydrolase n=1 Tax=Nocardia sp. bgisy118 TaxID=3413786 RepID=UPI003F4A2515
MTIHRFTLDNTPIELTVTDHCNGRPVLLLHGGAGPLSVSGFAALLADRFERRVIVPTHPGFDGTPRPETLTTIADLVRLYVELLDRLELPDVTVIGNSLGGWIAAEIALLSNERVGRVVIANAAGLDLPATPIADFFALTMDEVADLSYCHPDAFRIDMNSLPPQRLATIAGNRATLQTYGGTAMTDPTLLDRLPAITTPTLITWGQCDRMIPLTHATAYANAIPGARLEIISDAGHLPQLESPDTLARLVIEFDGSAG